MLTVTQNNQTEMLNQIQGFEMDEEVNGSLAVKVTSFSVENNPGYELTKEEAVINVDGYDFRVKQMRENRNKKDVTAISTFFDLVGKRKEEIYGGTHTFNEFASFVLNGTGWTFSSTDVIESRLIANFGNDNVIKLIQALCAVYECEYKIMPNNHVIFSKQVGGNYDAQYRYAHNVQALSKSVDTTNLRTRITGNGSDGLVVTYTSPNADIFGIRDAEPVFDERFTIANSMLERIKRDLIDYPEVTLELDSVELTNKELGERVWLNYEPMGVEFQTRVLSKKSIIRGNKLVTKSVILGNTIPRNPGDLLISQKVEIDEYKKETRSKFEQTNERITLEVEAVNESIATIELQAESIVLSVTDLSGRMGNAESQLSVQAGLISTKVSRDGIISSINQSPEVIELDASRIQLKGITNVANTLYIGDSVRDGTPKSIQFRGPSGGVGIYSNSIDNLEIGAVNRLELVSSTIDFNFANIEGLTVPYATNAGNTYSLGGYSSTSFPLLASHQNGASVSFAGNGDMTWVVNGNVFTYRKI